MPGENAGNVFFYAKLSCAGLAAGFPRRDCLVCGGDGTDALRQTGEASSGGSSAGW